MTPAVACGAGVVAREPGGDVAGGPANDPGADRAPAAASMGFRDPGLAAPAWLGGMLLPADSGSWGVVGCCGSS